MINENKKDKTTVAIESCNARINFNTVGKLDEQELQRKQTALTAKLERLRRWFAFYDAQVAEYDRSVRMGTVFDQKYGSICELDKKAEAKKQHYARALGELRKVTTELRMRQEWQSLVDGGLRSEKDGDYDE